MTVGLSIASANAALDALGGTLYAQMHSDDPGADGTSNVAFVTERVLTGLPLASSGSRALTTPVTWASVWSGGNQTVKYLSLWDASTAGNFILSLVTNSDVEFIDGMIPRLNTLVLSAPSLAAD